MSFNLSSFLQSRTNVYLYRKLGWKPTLIYIMFLGKLYFFFRPKEKQKIKRAIGAVFAKTAALPGIRGLRRRVFRGIFFHYYEKLFNAYSDADTLKAFFDIHVQSRGLEAIDNGLSKGKGVLLITGHFGGVEFLPAYLGICRYPVTIVVRFACRYLREISIQKARQFNTKIIDADNTANVMKEILQSLKENRVVITQCDEIDEWRPSTKERILFLGKETPLDRTMNILHKRGAADLVFGVMHRDGSQRYKFIGSTKKEMEAAVPGASHLSPGALVLKFLEQYIYANPDEWYQWKKYFQIASLPSSDVAAERPLPIPVLNPSFGKAS
jgi:Kdo2-lipid IVA lauroyltransferase/acyltransferase